MSEPSITAPRIHARHPGIGSSTSLIRLEADDPHHGGFLIFFPSGRHMTISWETETHITPTKEAALTYVGKVVEELNKASASMDQQTRDNAEQDLRSTNWVSVAAAVQRLVLDFNTALSTRISDRMAAAYPPIAGITRKH